MKKVLLLSILCVVLCLSTAYASEQQVLTRQDFCTQIYSVLKYTEPFADVEITQSFVDCDAKAVNQLNTMGIVSGIGDNMFNPYDNITREEAAAIFGRICDYMELPVTLSEYEYADHSDISDWATDSVYKAYHSGVFKGTDDVNFSPKALITLDLADKCAIKIYNMYTGSPFASTFLED